jgi:tetratricopeptide (TPR) repeat protein
MARTVLGRLDRMPRAVLLGGGVVALLGLAVAGYYFRIYSQSRAREEAAATAWRSFDDAASRADQAGMCAAVERLIELRPDDPVALARRESLRTGSADPNDVQLATALVSLHLERDRLPDAAREARKVLAHDPKHWRSLCVLSHHAIRFNHDVAEARRWLDALPDPTDPVTPLDSGGLLHALQLSKQLDRDPSSLRRAIVMRVLPFLRGGAVEFVQPLGKAQLIECYLESFADRSMLTELLDHWGEVSRLMHSAITRAENTGDAIVLVQLAQLGHRLREALRQFHEHDLVPVERFTVLARDLNDQTRRAWLAVHAREPGRVEPYSGLAVLAVAGGDYRQAVERLLAGMAACGERPELIELLSRLAAATGNAKVAVTLTRTAAEKDPTDPLKWCRAAEAALSAGQHDLALAACEMSRRLAPDNLWACRIQASVWLETRKADQAIELFSSLGEGTLRADAGLLRLAIRALVETGDVTTAEAVADEAENSERHTSSRLSVAAVRGLLDAARNHDLAARAAARSIRLVTHWCDDSHAWRLLADAHYRLAELSPTPWPADVARTALDAYARLPKADRSRPDVVAAVATLQLRALKDAKAARKTLAPLRDSAILPLLKPHQRELLAAAELASP